MQKNIPRYFPDWVSRAEVGKRDGVMCQVVGDKPATLGLARGLTRGLARGRPQRARGQPARRRRQSTGTGARVAQNVGSCCAQSGQASRPSAS